jgi:choline kinase
MKFVITSAGMGSRFAKVGITCSKYEIKAKGQSLFYLSMIGLKKYFDSEFIFLFRKGFYSEQFIADEIKKLGIKKFQIKLVDELTDGQASTALLADEFMQPNDEFCIFNTDTYVLPKALDNLDFNVDGLVPCFKVEGDH